MKKSGFRSLRCGGIVAPTLRKVREGWGTRLIDVTFSTPTPTGYNKNRALGLE
jgi:hypothetical protein